MWIQFTFAPAILQMCAELGQLLCVFCKQTPGNVAPAQVGLLSRRCDRNNILESSRNNQQQLK